MREFLQLNGISKRTLTATKYNGGSILVNGIEQNVRHLLKKGDEVCVFFPVEEPSKGLRLEDGNLTIVYEDEVLMIVDKPANQSTIPSRDHPSGTIANSVAGKFAREQVPSTVHIVTRLDKDTSGLICIAKNRHIHHLLSEQMIKSGFQRQYTALVEGHLANQKIKIEQPIGRKEGSIIERTVCENGQYARTDVEVQGYYRIEKKFFSKIKLVLYTGRTHQIRVHMQWAGYPLLGDDLYGGTLQLLNRQALHCSLIGFKHPLTDTEMIFTSELPKDMQSLVINGVRCSG